MSKALKEVFGVQGSIWTDSGKALSIGDGGLETTFSDDAHILCVVPRKTNFSEGSSSPQPVAAPTLSSVERPSGRASEAEITDYGPYHRKQTFVSDDIKLLTVSLDSGNISVVGSIAEKSEVVVTKREFSEGCLLDVKVKEGKLVVDISSPRGKRLRCQADVTAIVAPDVDVDVSTALGEIAVTSIGGTIDFKTAKGNVLIDSSPEALVGKTANGDISVKGLRVGADLKTALGNITVAYDRLPTAGSLDIKIANGNTVVVVPAGAKLQTDFLSYLGRLQNDVGDNPNAKFKVVVRAAKGDLHIKHVTRKP